MKCFLAFHSSLIHNIITWFRSKLVKNFCFCLSFFKFKKGFIKSFSKSLRKKGTNECIWWVLLREREFERIFHANKFIARLQKFPTRLNHCLKIFVFILKMLLLRHVQYDEIIWTSSWKKPNILEILKNRKNMSGLNAD